MNQYYQQPNKGSLCVQESTDNKSLTRLAKQEVNSIAFAFFLVLGVSVLYGTLSYLIECFALDSISYAFSFVVMSFSELSVRESVAFANSALNSYALKELLSALRYFVCFFVPFYAVIRLRCAKVTDFFNLKGRLNQKIIPYTFFIIIASAFLGNISSVFFSEKSQSVAVGELSQYSILATVIWLISTTVVPATLEEFIFRGYILGTLLPFGKNFAIVVSSVFFALTHSYDSMLFALCAGIFFAYLTVSTGNMKTPMIIHFVNNFISCIIMLAERKLPALFDIISISYPFIVFALGIAGAMIFAYTYKKISGNLQYADTTKNEVKVTAMFTPVFLIYLLLLWLPIIWG